MPTYNRPEDADSKLLRLLLKATPKNELGHQTISHLAECLKITRWSIHKWINNDRIPPDRVVDIVKLADGRVKQSDFDEFVYKT